MLESKNFAMMFWPFFSAFIVRAISEPIRLSWKWTNQPVHRKCIKWSHSCHLFDDYQMPSFVGPVENVTVPVGREAIISCKVDNLGSYKIGWVRVETQTILSIHTHVITRSHRIGLSHTDSWTWNLHIRHVKESDRGFYMCQINTDPMMSQLGYLQVVVPPDILDYPTSTDMVVREGTNVTLMCAATGFPKPTVTWQREDKQKIPYGDQLVESVEGPVFNISKVNRLHMGAYLCIANNGVPPKVSRRILIIVHFPPMIWVQNQLVGAGEGDDVVLECQSEAFPKSINYWVKHNGDIIVSGVDGSPIDSYNGEKYEPILLDNAYKVTMRLTVRGVQQSDYGNYVCLSKNALGETDGQIKLYPLISSTVAAKTTTLPSSNSVTNPVKATGRRNNTTNARTKPSNKPRAIEPKPQLPTAIQIGNHEASSSSTSTTAPWQLYWIFVVILRNLNACKLMEWLLLPFG